MSRSDDLHLDDDTLALVALGERFDEVSTAHLEGCAQCHEVIASYARVVLAGRTLEPAELVLEMPPASVWDRIAAEAGLTSPSAMGAATDGGEPPVELSSDGPSTGAAPLDPTPAGDTSPTVVRMADRARTTGDPRTADRRPSRTGWLVAAGIAGLLAGVGGTVAWQAATSDKPGVVVATEMAPLPAKSGTGEAVLRGTGADRELNLTLDAADVPSDTYLQVWLMSPDLQRMVPVGVLENGVGFWRVPADLDLAEYPVVDVSIEPFDGNSAHSSDSLVRGTLHDA